MEREVRAIGLTSERSLPNARTLFAVHLPWHNYSTTRIPVVLSSLFRFLPAITQDTNYTYLVESFLECTPWVISIV